MLITCCLYLQKWPRVVLGWVPHHRTERLHPTQLCRQPKYHGDRAVSHTGNTQPNATQKTRCSTSTLSHACRVDSLKVRDVVGFWSCTALFALQMVLQEPHQKWCDEASAGPWEHTGLFPHQGEWDRQRYVVLLVYSTQLVVVRLQFHQNPMQSCYAVLSHESLQVDCIHHLMLARCPLTVRRVRF